MEYDSSRSGAEQPWRPLMQGFLALLEMETSHDRAIAICHLFLGDLWFQQLVERRARHAVETHAVPRDWGDDLRQEIALLFAQKVGRSPDLHVDRQKVEEHFGGWAWTMVERLGSNAIEGLHRRYRVESALTVDSATERKRDVEAKVALSIAMSELPPLTRTILELYDKGHKLTEIAVLTREKYWKVVELFQKGIDHLKDRLTDRE